MFVVTLISLQCGVAGLSEVFLIKMRVGIDNVKKWLFSGDLYLGTKMLYLRTFEEFQNQLDSLKSISHHVFKSKDNNEWRINKT